MSLLFCTYKNSSESLFVVGGNAHRTTELLSLNNWQWNVRDPYPHVTDIHVLNIISKHQSFYIFGGVFNGTLVTSEILNFKNDPINGTWSNVGNILSKRKQFSVTLVGDKVYLVGGDKKQKSEVCKLSNYRYLYLDIVQCEEHSQIGYQNFKQPVLFNHVDNCQYKDEIYESIEVKELVIISKRTFQTIDSFASVPKTNFRHN